MDGRTMALMFGLMAFAFIGLMAWLAARTKPMEVRKKRLDVLDKALQHPQLDAETRSQILRVLAEEQRREATTWLQRLTRYAPLGRTLWYSVGWILFVIGGCMSVLVAIEIAPRSMVPTCASMTMVGFAMLSLPLALGELTRRQRAPVADR